MTGRDDFDRLLGDWLAEGPARTPEPVLVSALQHARTHPRRPNVLGFLRRDPMAARASLFGISPVPVLAALGLLLAAAIGVSLVGGQQDDAPPPVPPSTPVPTIEPTIGPSTAPTTGPTTGPSASVVPSASVLPSPIRVGLRTSSSATMTVDVLDHSGNLVDARTAPPVQGGSVAAGTVAVTNVDDQTLLLTWTDAACDIAYTLTMDTPTQLTLESPVCNGDTIAVDRRLLLQLASPVDASTVVVTVVRAP